MRDDIKLLIEDLKKYEKSDFENFAYNQKEYGKKGIPASLILLRLKTILKKGVK
jgi:hypothetical protein